MMVFRMLKKELLRCEDLNGYSKGRYKPLLHQLHPLQRLRKKVCCAFHKCVKCQHVLSINQFNFLMFICFFSETDTPDEPADYPASDAPDTPDQPSDCLAASSDCENPSSSEENSSPSPPSSMFSDIMEMDFLRRERDQAHAECSKLREAFNLVRLSSKTVEGDDRKCKYYTGLPWDIFITTYKFCESAANHKGIPKLPYVDQFFLTLVKLRHGTKFEYLADQAGLSHPSTMVDYFWKWVDLITSQLRFIIAWPDRERIFKTIPPHFKASFPRLTGIIDCSEFFIETPGPVKARAQCYSNYKKHTTVKLLIACTPLGAVSFLSPLYGGRISDVNLVRECGFLSPSLHSHGDQILADRGFTMKDEFAGYLGVEPIVPAFCKGKAQFSSEEVQSSRNMSSVRIHVERVIGLLKNRFAILQGVLPLRLIKSIKDEVEEADLTSADKIIMSCAILTNLTASIVYRQ